jgi:hypothetical protein
MIGKGIFHTDIHRLKSEQPYLNAKCIASDDPRLKKK